MPLSLSLRTNAALRLPVSLCVRAWAAGCLLVVTVGTTVVAQRPPDTVAVVQDLNRAHEYLIQHNYKEAGILAKQTFDASTAIDYRNGVINSLLIVGQAEKSMGNYTASLNSYLQALSEAERQRNNPMRAWINQRIGALLQEWGVPDKALVHYQAAFNLLPEKQREVLFERMAELYLSLDQKGRALELYQQLLQSTRQQKKTFEEAGILERIAFIYYQSGDLQNSLQYNLQLLEANRQLNDPGRIAATQNVVGNQYKELNDTDKALFYYQESLALNRRLNENGSTDNSIVTNLINIGAVYQTRGDMRNALRSFNEALEIKRRKGTPVEIAVMHNYLASLQLSQANYPEAERHTQTAIELLSSSENKRMLATNLKRLSDIYSKQSKFQESLAVYQQYAVLKDSVLYLEQLSQEREQAKQYAIETTERQAKQELIDHEMKALSLRNEKEKAERERQEIALLLKEKELQNISLQNKQLEQARAVQQLQLKQVDNEKRRQEQEILVLEQKRDLQQAELEQRAMREEERKKEIAFKNATLELQQAQLERATIQQQLLIFIAILFLAIIMLVLIGYYIKRRNNRMLQEQFDEITFQKQQIESINESLIELNEEKNDLIGIVAHDLKSPLNQIGGMLEIMKLTTRGQEEQHGYTLRIEESTKRLKKMVSKILDVSAIEAKTLNITVEQVDTRKLLDEIVKRYEPQAIAKQIVIVREFASAVPPVATDSGYLSEVLENLMSNAVKYSPLGKQITVRLSQTSNNIRFEFQDQGQGINEKDMKNLFGKYRKLSARPTAGEDSTGLGLSIVKKYVLALRGNVWCESEEGRGANFIVELPVI